MLKSIAAAVGRPRAYRLALLSGLAALALVGAGCGGTSKTDQQRAGFVAGCVNSGRGKVTKELCTCEFEQLKKRGFDFSRANALRLKREAEQGRVPPVFIEALRACGVNIRP